MLTGTQKDGLLGIVQERLFQAPPPTMQSVSSPHPCGFYCSQLLTDSPMAWNVRLNMARLATLRGFSSMTHAR